MTVDQSLVKWINSFDGLSEHCDSYKDLADGVLLYEICHQISTKHFDSTLIPRSDSKDNWVLRTENVNTLLASLDSYFSVELGLTGQTTHLNIDSLARDLNREEIIKLIELIIGVVVECENKGEYIGKMQDLDPEVQNDLMVIIERIMTDHQQQMSENRRASFDAGEEPIDVYSRSVSSPNVKDTLSQIESQITQLQKEKSELQVEIEELTITVTQGEQDKKGWEKEKENLLEVCSNLQQSLEYAQKRLDDQKQQSSLNMMSDLRVKEEINNLQQKIEDKEKQVFELRKKVDESAKQANENRDLRDEIDILREKVQNAEATEDKLRKYQHKVEEIAELKRQMKTLEENNDNYLNQILDLEEQVRKSSSFKTQLETTKQQLMSLKIDNTKLEMSLKSITEDRDRLQLTLSQLEQDHSSLSGQIDSQRIKIEQLQQDSDSKLLESTSSPFASGGGLDQVMDSATKERLARLERENKRFKESIDKLPELETQLEEANAAKEELTKQLALMQSASSPTQQQHHQSSIVIQELNQKILDMNNNTQLKSQEVEKMKVNVETANTSLLEKNKQLEASAKQVDELRAQLVDLYNKQSTSTMDAASKETIANLVQEKDKLEGYLRAARKMIKGLREKEKEGEGKEAKMLVKEEHIAQLENTIKLKDERLESFAKQIKEAKEAQQRELNLMLTAFLNIGLEVETLKVKNDHSKEPRAFLNKKRADGWTLQDK
ncbi:hypothetical protein SAMD00019534_047010 [Acytostelium subglobosum LB1]|uniref:hypothetical protein n=1 Tax=Acytostelium subglobosum LB1 TaxID=1410327 RepID=UPI000644C2E5|nr:hypothetical protein SAMD00019534_047010 [Acytostelium subglobosum LB1]GAM21526.1 hypothetical protein SAMD00019534_047010 [Acytostelium subglobosum LB1]|eukprot:XP_012755645.1 hypothetical protein SAMD00019534_047010 [Acytostelium subglobosum LB1]